MRAGGGGGGGGSDFTRSPCELSSEPDLGRQEGLKQAEEEGESLA